MQHTTTYIVRGREEYERDRGGKKREFDQKEIKLEGEENQEMKRRKITFFVNYSPN